MEAELQRLSLEDESEEEDEEELLVMLGFTQGAKPRSLERQNFPHKAGGAPAWLDPENLPSINDACCGFCNEPMQFLLQVYAPDDRSDTFHRMLFVFMCVKMACLKKDQLEQQKKNGGSARSVKVFRAQLPRQNKFYSSAAPDSPLTNGVRLCDWCRTWKGEKFCGGCRKVTYCSRKHQVEHWHADHSSTCKTPENRLSSKKLWPELEIYTCEEPVDEESDDDARQNPLQIVSTKQDTLSKELQEFEEPSKDDKCWGAFEERIRRAPGQVLRYCRETGAKPLWTRLQGQPEAEEIIPCHRCGATRTYEFQVLPQLLYYFGVENEPDSLDWGTIVVFSCSDSCGIEGYTEEFAWVQLSS